MAMEEWVEHVEESRLMFNECVNANIRKAQLVFKAGHDRRSSGRPYAIGDLVKITNERKPMNGIAAKFNKKYVGPFVVVEAPVNADSATYVLMDALEPSKKPIRIHFNRMSTWRTLPENDPRNNMPVYKHLVSVVQAPDIQVETPNVEEYDDLEATMQTLLATPDAQMPSVREDPPIKPVLTVQSAGSNSGGRLLVSVAPVPLPYSNPAECPDATPKVKLKTVIRKQVGKRKMDAVLPRQFTAIKPNPHISLGGPKTRGKLLADLDRAVAAQK
jgi:hypothetical protein